MEMEFKKVRKPMYCLFFVVVLLVALIYGSNHVAYTMIETTGPNDTLVVTNTLFGYLYGQIIG